MTDLIPTIEIVSDRPVVSSLKVAEQFGKAHRNVVRDIRKIITEVSAEFSALNFEHCEYIGDNGKPAPMFWLTKDGFTILAMGYTGKEIMRLKEAYIRRFNDMEQQIHGRALPAAEPTPDPTGTITPGQQRELHNIMDAKCSVLPKELGGKARAEGWTRFNRHFRIGGYGQLPAAKFSDALDYLIAMEFKTKAALPESPKLALPAAQVEDLKDKAMAYYNAVMDANYQWNKIMGNVERLGKELADAMGAAIMPMIGSDSDPASVMARHKFLDALKSSPRCAMRSMDVSILALMDHAQLMCGLSVLGR